jgi:D-proline reductase (dithiol) PrdB
VSLVARHLEAAGIPTVIIGSARDIVEECGVPRFLFVDFPLGNPCGKPWDVEMQRKITSGALELLERAWLPRTTVQRPETWAKGEADARWRERFMWVGDDNREALARAGETRREARADRRPGNGARGSGIDR